MAIKLRKSNNKRPTIQPESVPQKTKKLLKKRENKAFKCLFADYTCREDYENAGIKELGSMDAKEPLDDKMLQSMLSDDNIIAEDKLDGTRCLLHFVDGKCRAFSRTVSKKTGWYSENTDRIPHIRDTVFPDTLGYTIIDGELKIPDKPFETTSGILNTLPEEAVQKQEKEGKFVLNAFDILWFNGKCVENEPLFKRKAYLNELLSMIDNPYIVNHPWFTKSVKVTVTDNIISRYLGSNSEFFSVYPLLYEQIRTHYSDNWDKTLELNKAEYYEYVVINGGEGIMLKDPNGKYLHKRGREFTKYKKFLTRDVVAIRFSEPTQDYTGKELKTWGYWSDPNDRSHKIPFATSEREVKKYKELGYIPVTKPYYYNWFGNLIFGVVVDDSDIEYLKSKNGKDFKNMNFHHNFNDTGLTVLEVGECAGFDDVTKDKFTKDPSLILGECVEVKCNEIFKKTGKLRHPRFMRVRTDKDIEMCVFKDHIQSDGNMNE